MMVGGDTVLMARHANELKKRDARITDLMKDVRRGLVFRFRIAVLNFFGLR
jgi:hypothetical protein